MPQVMPEPTSAVATGVVAKLFSPAVIGAALSSTIVMVMTMPKTKKQQFIALLTTMAGSIFGGSAIVDWYHLDQVLSTTALGGVYLVAGLPIWIIIRGFYAYTERD